ncbi:MAG: hypothetical protein EBU34_14680 [Alphaproteobacteria bacterium]|nr:hypothetical protein [Alphaproteobacteria bacterium]
MAAHFVEPLIQAELSRGYQSMMINSCYVAVGRGKLIRYDLALSNLFGLPWHFSGTPCEVLAPPAPGEHTAEILGAASAGGAGHGV